MMTGVTGMWDVWAGTADPPVRISVSPPPAQEMPQSLQARVLLEPRHEAMIGSPLDARITALPVREGDAFRRGAPLVRFDCQSFQARLLEEQAARHIAQITLENKQRLARLTSIGGFEVERTQAELQLAEARVKTAQVPVDRCIVRAPYDGWVHELRVHAHETVTTGQSLLSIIGQGRPRLRLVAPSSWLPWVRPGTPFQVRIDETGRRHNAQITHLTPRVNAVSQSVTLFGRMDASTDDLIPGMSGTAHFTRNPAHPVSASP
jgi:RND family efflux transporter MFP subunit